MAFTDFIPAIGKVVGSVIDNTWGMANSKQLMDYQAKLQQEMIDKANAYNDPQRQMERLANAGLNPNLVYGSGSVTGNQSDSGKVSAVNRQTGFDVGATEAVAARLQRINTESQVKQRDVQNDEMRQRVAESQARTLGVLLDNRWKDASLDDRIKQEAANLAHTQQSINESTQRVSNMQVQANLITEQIKLTEQRTGLTAAQIQTELCRPSEVRARTKYLQESAETTAKQREVMDSVLKLNDAKIEQLMASAFELWSRGTGEQLENQMTAKIAEFNLGGNITAKDMANYVLQLLKIMAKGN